MFLLMYTLYSLKGASDVSFTGALVPESWSDNEDASAFVSSCVSLRAFFT